MLGSWFRQMLNDFGTPGAPHPMTEEQVYFLSRLERLASLRRDAMLWGRLNDAGQELVRRAVYSTYCDCVDLGVEPEARRLLHPAGASPGELEPSAERER